LRDSAERVYRNGGGEFGEGLAIRIVRDACERLRAQPRGGTLLLYTGSAVVDGNDTFLSAIQRELSEPGLSFSYEELDPDVFSEELELPQYMTVERIAAVFLTVNLLGRRD
jgi:hypothetical protein